MARKKDGEPKPIGRPSSYTEAAGEAICERIAAGESLRAIVKDDAMPGETTVRRWLASEGNEFEAFRRQYAHARDAQADNYAERVVDEALSATDAAIGRLRMDALKWAASKLAPKKYGDAVQLKHADANGGPLTPVLNVTIGGARPEPAPEAG